MYGQKHFYYPNESTKSLSSRKYIGTDEAGRALHYLQDMTQPNHIDSGSIITKAKEAAVPHHRFEINAYDKQNNFYDNYTPIEINANSFNDLFDKTVNISFNPTT